MTLLDGLFYSIVLYSLAVIIYEGAKTWRVTHRKTWVARMRIRLSDMMCDDIREDEQ